MKLIEVPLTFLRNYTCPMADHECWDKKRAAVIPMTVPITSLWLYGLMQDDDDHTILYAGLLAIIPGGIIGFLILMKTKKGQAPNWLMTILSFTCFVMSVLWIKFTSDVIMDVL